MAPDAPIARSAPNVHAASLARRAADVSAVRAMVGIESKRGMDIGIDMLMDEFGQRP